MKNQTTKCGFTMIELLVVIAVVAVVAGMLLPALGGNKANPLRIACVNNLKQVGIGFRLYAGDGAPYPEYSESNQVWQYFQTVGREIGSPKVLLCPADTAKTKLKNRPLDFENPPTPNSLGYPMFRNAALSYFYNPDAAEIRPEAILFGDRNVSTNLGMISGLLNVETNTPVQWTEDLHKTGGNILLADGSAQQMPTAKLREQVRLGTNGTQRFLIP